MIFTYKFPYSLTSNLFKNEFKVKFHSQLKTCIDYLEFIGHSDFSSLTYYDNISITFSEEVLDLIEFMNFFSDLKNEFPEKLNLYELDFWKIHEKLIPLTQEFVLGKYEKNRKKLSLQMILTQINLTLQIFNIVELRKSI